MNADIYVHCIRDRVPGGFARHPMYQPFQNALVEISAEYGVTYVLVKSPHSTTNCTVSSVRRITNQGVPHERIIAIASLMFPDLT